MKYDYRCMSCGHVFEHEHVSPLPSCPKCKQESKKLISKPAVIYRGKGWGGKA